MSTVALADGQDMLIDILDRALTRLWDLQLIPSSSFAVLVVGRRVAPGLQHHTSLAEVGDQGCGSCPEPQTEWSEASCVHLVDEESRRLK